MGRFGPNVALVAIALFLGGIAAAQAGPCTAQIAQTERQIRNLARNPATGPTGQQTVGAQLHHQPTPGSVQSAEAKAKDDALSAIERARAADAAGDAVACANALRQAKDLFGLN